MRMEANTHIRIKAILEVLGKPKEYVEEKLKEYVEKIKEDESLMIMDEKFSEAKEHEKVFTTFAELEVVIKGIENLIGFCIDYMPSSIEIIKPEKLGFENRHFTNFTNDMLAKLHKVDMIAKQLGTENKFLKRNMNNIIKNNIMILVKGGIGDLEGMSKSTGIDKEEIKKYVDNLVEEKRLKEENGEYSLR